ncbi:MAG TPA: hypothetical protein VF809_02730, partial [Candidatus Saccharimonadales bacterium]
MKGRIFAIKRGQAKAAALAEFKDPLLYLDEKAIRKLRFRVVRLAIICMLVGGALVALVIWASPGLQGMRYMRPSGPMFFFAMGTYLFCLGIYKLCTLRRGMVNI